MSRCTLRIEFDRADRTYRSGDEVSGTLYVQVDQTTTCGGLILEHFWQTHGRGNSDRGDVQTTILTEGQWNAGDEFQFAFSFTAPAGPPTYRGHYLNIDHYISARVDVPWAFDPQVREEYVLLPGGDNYGHLPEAPRTTGMSEASKVGLPIGALVMLVILIAFPPSAIVILPLAAIGGFLMYRKVLAERRIGSVRIEVGPRAVPPGGTLPLTLSFVPRTTCSLNRITAKIIGREICTSGSGTRRTTHRHVLHERTFELLGSREVVAGEPIELRFKIPVPDIGAFSFAAPKNKLHWELETRVDIPLWPDWIDNRFLVVRPGDGAEDADEVVDATVVEPPVVAEIKSSDSGSAPIVARASSAERPAGAPTELVTSREVPPAADLGTAESTGADTPEPRAGDGEPVERSELARLVERLAALPSYDNRHQEHIDAVADRTFPCEVVVDRVSRTFGLIDQPRFQGGRTIVGTLAGLGREAEIRTDQKSNEQIDALKPGQSVRLDCAVTKWDTLRKRVLLNEA